MAKVSLGLSKLELLSARKRLIQKGISPTKINVKREAWDARLKKHHPKAGVKKRGSK